MENFKKFFEAKGAFARFPVDKHPQRIPFDVYDELKSIITNKLQGIADVFIPSTKKSVGKVDTGDIDVIINPYNRNKWREEIEKLFSEYIVAKKSNGPQLMTVMKGLVDNNQYMVDFILAKDGAFDYRTRYAQFGTVIPAVVGSFARSLRYKFDQNALYIRLLSGKGNYHNILLTDNFEKAMKILMLDMEPVKNDNLYTPEQVAQWVVDSPRFDSSVWHKPPSPDGQTIVTKNGKSHRALKIRPEVKKCYQLIDSVKKTATWDNTDYKIERMVLGDAYIDSIIKDVQEVEKKSDNVITGNDIMRILNIRPGPEVGKYVKHIKDAGLNKDEAMKYLQQIKDNM